MIFHHSEKIISILKMQLLGTVPTCGNTLFLVCGDLNGIHQAHSPVYITTVLKWLWLFLKPETTATNQRNYLDPILPTRIDKNCLNHIDPEKILISIRRFCVNCETLLHLLVT